MRGKAHVLKVQNERVHVSPTTSHVLQGCGLCCQVTMKALFPSGYGHHSSTCNRKESAVHSTLDMLTRAPASILVTKRKSSSYGKNNFCRGKQEKVIINHLNQQGRLNGS